MDLPRLDKVPSVATVMTAFPYTVSIDATLLDAATLMREHDISHIPVEDEHRLVGVITQRDVALIASRSASDAMRLPIRDLVLGEPYIVDLHTSLGIVAREMADRGLDAALVVREGRIAGIFTFSDACRVLAEIMRQGGAGPGPVEVA